MNPAPPAAPVTAPTTALEVAKLLVELAARQPQAEPLTLPRLHKLLYFCQGLHLAWMSAPLFAEAIVAAETGTQLPALVAVPSGPAELRGDVRTAAEHIWSHYGNYSTAGLAELVRKGPLWRDRRAGGEIPVGEMAECFGSEFERQTGETRGALAEFRRDLAEGRLTSHEQLMKELGW